MEREKKSVSLLAASKLFFFDIRETREGKPYLVITESLLRGEGERPQRSSIMIFQENMEEFAGIVAKMAKGEVGPAQEIADNPLRSKALEVIRKTYEAAGMRRSVNNTKGEDEVLFQAKGMEEMAVKLGILTNAEADILSNEYWDSPHHLEGPSD